MNIEKLSEWLRERGWTQDDFPMQCNIVWRDPITKSLFPLSTAIGRQAERDGIPVSDVLQEAYP